MNPGKLVHCGYVMEVPRLMRVLQIPLCSNDTAFYNPCFPFNTPLNHLLLIILRLNNIADVSDMDGCYEVNGPGSMRKRNLRQQAASRMTLFPFVIAKSAGDEAFFEPRVPPAEIAASACGLLAMIFRGVPHAEIAALFFEKLAMTFGWALCEKGTFGSKLPPGLHTVKDSSFR